MIQPYSRDKKFLFRAIIYLFMRAARRCANDDSKTIKQLFLL